ncbi:MAG: DUF1501 domain-containing protein [Gemmataceae bacterium]|nr:DUF1501 domain-containing protein [Gemmataceae bacterium]
MLNLFGNNHRECDGMNRRNFLSVGALGAIGGASLMSLPDLLRMRAEASAQGQATRDASVVWLWLGGGATHVETFDPKMSAPEEFRSTVGAVQTNVAGIQIGGLLPRIGTVANKMAFVRSFAHGSGSHGAGTYWINTGYNSRNQEGAGTQQHPSSGSILSRQRGANHPTTGMPTYVRLNPITGDGASWLGRAYEPFATTGQSRLNMEPRVTVDQLQDRRALQQSFDNISREVDSTGMLEGLDQFGRQAYELVQGNARQAFDVTRESASTREQYGRGLGEQMLLARRLCEAGCGFVTINYGGWDMHSNIANSLRARCGDVDRAVSAFVADTVARGVDRNILLVVTGEFGRTPRVNRNAGRDHWGSLCTLAMAGGGLRMGQTVGESSSKVERPQTAPISPTDLKATVLHALGMPRDLQFTSPIGRPTYMIEGGRPIAELV